MTGEEIELELKDVENDIFFVGALPSFVWDEKNKSVVGYWEQQNKDNKLVVLETEIIELKTSLLKYLEKEKVEPEDVLVFCINEQYYPTRKGNFIRIKILKNIHPKKYDKDRIDS